MMAGIIKLIYTEERRGTGKADDPTRLLPQLWSLRGFLVAERDPLTGLSEFIPDNIEKPDA
jgi:hypothetical protein